MNITDSSSQESPKIEFPCDYPIRIVGTAAPDFEAFVVECIRQHTPDFNGVTTIRESRTGKYLSVLVTIRATGEAHLKAIHKTLMDSGRVHMVL
ncbi:hypothetical protein CI610_00559 [invertebrate metagenome]|uniref:Proposed lipoate regulatory protein YbeD n=1 Tax=invertebrate metagenome TaxID=1711999 RepID=A0A2H9TB49_9ZZZZ